MNIINTVRDTLIFLHFCDGAEIDAEKNQKIISNTIISPRNASK